MVQPVPEPTPEPVSVNAALANAARVLRHAEGETDRQLMSLMTDIADGWINMARVALEQDAIERS